MNKFMKISLTCFCAAFATCCAFGYSSMPKYATDAYPCFETNVDNAVLPKKTPRMFSWWNGPKKDTPAEQLKWAESLSSPSSAKKAYDALVRQWPSSKEAPAAQQRLAQICIDDDNDFEEAFNEYRYLLDYYSLQCDYTKISRLLYDLALKMKKTGTTVLFIPFANERVVRKAFEAVVIRAPGADFAPQAMIEIAALRVQEDDYDEAVKVYETLRNVYPSSSQAEDSILLEAELRVKLLEDHSSNADRAKETYDFLKFSLSRSAGKPYEVRIKELCEKVYEDLENGAYLAAKSYDSVTRKKRNAIAAYEKFLTEYPSGVHALEVKSRLDQLKAESKK
jgi:TolA-binding protein